jgi:hypothetical protein
MLEVLVVAVKYGFMSAGRLAAAGHITKDPCRSLHLALKPGRSDGYLPRGDSRVRARRRAAIRQETGSLRWPMLSIIIQLVLSFSAAIAVFQVTRLA